MTSGAANPGYWVEAMYEKGNPAVLSAGQPERIRSSKSQMSNETRRV